MEQIQESMLYKENEPYTFQKFLRKFDILEKINWNRENIKKVIQQISWNIVAEKINYCELKLSIGRYVRDSGLNASDVIKFIHDIISEEEQKWDVRLPIILCLKYESDKKQQLEFSNIIKNGARDCVSGIDLVGDEEYLDIDFYIPIFKRWKDAGKGLQAHVGESQSAENVRLAIEKLNVDRIAHGIHAADHPDILDLAKSKDVCFDIALSSNVYTGVVKSISEHPIRKLFEKIDVTIGTDDPVILNTNLDNEYRILLDLGFTENEILQIIDNSIYHAFDPYISCLSKRVNK